MNAADRLAQIEARANAATEGRWEVDTYGTSGGLQVYSGRRGVVADRYLQAPDANFIAHARTDVPALVAALRAVLEFADLWEASPAVGYNSAEQWEFDTLRDAGRDLRTDIEEALG